MEVMKGGIIMLKNIGQTEMELSPYQGLYDAIIPKDHILRRLKENIDFSFVNPMLKKQYCEHFGRPAKEPEMIFKCYSALCMRRKPTQIVKISITRSSWRTTENTSKSMRFFHERTFSLTT